MIDILCQNAKNAKTKLAKLNSSIKKEVLNSCADEILANIDGLLKANLKDINDNSNLKSAFVDRLRLNENRINNMISTLRNVALLDDVVGRVVFGKTLENGLKMQQIKVPLGVVAIIFESRPNVCVDAFALCFKSSNVVILRGGKEALNTNLFLVSIFQKVLKRFDLDENFVQIVSDTNRDLVKELLRANDYIDVVIPRGSASLINEVKNNSLIPCIQTGVGNCHIYVDYNAKIDDAINIINNAKTQRPGVCNSVETLLINKNIASEILPLLESKMPNVELRVCAKCEKFLKNYKKANDSDWEEEFEDLILAIKIVDDINEAILHIQKYSTNHSEAIISQDYTNINKFLDEIDSAVLYVNASTRFSDGAEFGYAAEIGISTQKLHARGPMGLNELTTTKYQIIGNAHIRK
ncbi:MULTISPECIES: glutamate-5-semialdehyde dehydrogenase [unclassified Campylobacter]|uniref:glutamate-5-semialdehyde dehydrogenase n=1 Tax=unclassified Campylobacter TaxID=2593542 RepID=UPI001BDA1A4D|nr:glutamate-5-semialdehyde dehydrogenase [Campylobacter sp. 2018MI13]MBT0883210.1 glutamate-5-semialdehyde dehydrogenase [Campylobacter sp. 2018MI13]MBZ7975923.1 glutamate-5-semialdehyde dehydrogenase [Campylobacter sp. RM12637]MBZ7982986.1 glutamate-5-semialdehyde dehydrogenase [Campylobacter sp. RM12647]